MEILGRQLEAVAYEGYSVVNAYVRLKQEDCKRKEEPSYKCFDSPEHVYLKKLFNPD